MGLLNFMNNVMCQFIPGGPRGPVTPVAPIPPGGPGGPVAPVPPATSKAKESVVIKEPRNVCFIEIIIPFGKSYCNFPLNKIQVLGISY